VLAYSKGGQKGGVGVRLAAFSQGWKGWSYPQSWAGLAWGGRKLNGVWLMARAGYLEAGKDQGARTKDQGPSTLNQTGFIGDDLVPILRQE